MIFPSFMLICCIAAGLHPAVAELGTSANCGCLRRYTCGPLDQTPFDPNKRTIVITHGWNPFPSFVRLTTPEAYARAIVSRCGNDVNVLAWDWNAATFPSWSGRVNSQNAVCQGRILARELQCMGVKPENTWLIGHSLGALVMSSAARDLAECGRPVARLTLLDAIHLHHRIIFGQLCAHVNACCVENFWAARPSGVGGRARWPGVYNRFVRGATPFRGAINPVRGNHVYVIEWYYNTICNPHCHDGFNR